MIFAILASLIAFFVLKYNRLPIILAGTILAANLNLLGKVYGLLQATEALGVSLSDDMLEEIILNLAAHFVLYSLMAVVIVLICRFIMQKKERASAAKARTEQSPED